jgi:hypothetical protein
MVIVVFSSSPVIATVFDTTTLDGTTLVRSSNVKASGTESAMAGESGSSRVASSNAARRVCPVSCLQESI